MFSVADPGCYFIPDPDFYLSDPGSNYSNKGGEGFVVLTSVVSTNFRKFQIISFLNRYRKRFEPIDKEIKYFYAKNCH
jgi:hypothetical protein